MLGGDWDLSPTIMRRFGSSARDPTLLVEAPFFSCRILGSRSVPRRLALLSQVGIASFET